MFPHPSYLQTLRIGDSDSMCHTKGQDNASQRTTILHLITGLGQGGAEQTLSRLVEWLDPIRFRNVIVSMMDEGILGGALKEKGLRVHCLRMKRGLPSPFGLLKLCRILKDEKPAILQTWLYHADLLGLLAGRCCSVPNILWNIRCSSMDMSKYSLCSKMVLWLCTQLSNRPDGIIVNSEAGRITHSSLGYRPKRWVLITNGIDTQKFSPSSSIREQLSVEFGIPPSSFWLGHAGRYDPMKDHDTLFAAFKEVLKIHPNTILIMAGDRVSEDNEQLMQSIHFHRLASRVFAIGLHNNMPAFLSSMDAVVSSSKGEGFPNVIAEAMSSGVPCIGTDVGDTKKLLGGLGELCLPQAPLELSSAIIRIISMESAKRKDLGEMARKRIVDHYSLANMIARYSEAYDEFTQ